MDMFLFLALVIPPLIVQDQPSDLELSAFQQPSVAASKTFVLMMKSLNLLVGKELIIFHIRLLFNINSMLMVIRLCRSNLTKIFPKTLIPTILSTLRQTRSTISLSTMQSRHLVVNCQTKTGYRRSRRLTTSSMLTMKPAELRHTIGSMLVETLLELRTQLMPLTTVKQLLGAFINTSKRRMDSLCLRNLSYPVSTQLSTTLTFQLKLWV